MGRTRDNHAQRIDNDTLARMDKLTGCIDAQRRQITWKVALAQECPNAYDPHPALCCDVTHRGEPAFTAILRGGQVNLLPLGIKRHPSHWHIVFPAEQTTDDPLFCLKRSECAPISRSPNHPLGKRRNKFPVSSNKT